MRTKHTRWLPAILLLYTLSFPGTIFAWSEHPMLVRPALKDLPMWVRLDAVEVKSLKTFLVEVEKNLEQFLAEHEKWSRANLPDYAPCPDQLAFKAIGNHEDILTRFYRAIRVNPHIKVPLYLHLLPHDDTEGRPVADPRDITTLTDISSMINTTYVWINEGEMVHPFMVVSSASDEPDYGFDLGLFDDNNTDYGAQYGFGTQSFGNPNLEYGSQAPFHMGFYHEAKILYKFGPFLKRTYLDYRLFLYRALAQFAFSQNQPYWGWRFAGWGLHYLNDVSMPYHMKPLPGVSTLRMIWINLKAMLGFPKAKNDAVQLVSNRHTVFEEFQVQVLRQALRDKNETHPFLKALASPVEAVPFSYDFLINTASKDSAKRAKEVDKALARYMPAHMVKDPKIEANDLPELDELIETINKDMGNAAIDGMTNVMAERMRSFSMHAQSYLDDVVSKSGI